MAENRLTRGGIAAAVMGAVAVGEARAAELDPALKNIMEYTYGAGTEPLSVVHDMVIGSSGAGRRALERQFAAMLVSSDATYECRDFICRQLWHMGSDESLQALAALMEDTRCCDMARYALERNMSDAAGQVLRDTLTAFYRRLAPIAATTDVSGPDFRELRLACIGLINSLGARRDGGATRLLQTILGGDVEDCAVAAASALGKIGGSRVKTALAGAAEKGSAPLRAAAATALAGMDE